MTIKKAVALLYPQHKGKIKQLKAELTTTANNSNFELIAIINANDKNDNYSLQQLIETISRQDQPVTLITDKNCCCSHIHIVAGAVFGTLLIARLVKEVYIYHGYPKRLNRGSEIPAPALEKLNTNFLGTSAFHLGLTTELLNKNLFF